MLRTGSIVRAVFATNEVFLRYGIVIDDDNCTVQMFDIAVKPNELIRPQTYSPAFFVPIDSYNEDVDVINGLAPNSPLWPMNKSFAIGDRVKLVSPEFIFPQQPFGPKDRVIPSIGTVLVVSTKHIRRGVKDNTVHWRDEQFVVVHFDTVDGGLISNPIPAGLFELCSEEEEEEPVSVSEADTYNRIHEFCAPLSLAQRKAFLSALYWCITCDGDWVADETPDRSICVFVQGIDSQYKTHKFGPKFDCVAKEHFPDTKDAASFVVQCLDKFDLHEAPVEESKPQPSTHGRVREYCSSLSIEEQMDFFRAVFYAILSDNDSVAKRKTSIYGIRDFFCYNSRANVTINREMIFSDINKDHFPDANPRDCNEFVDKCFCSFGLSSVPEARHDSNTEAEESVADESPILKAVADSRYDPTDRRIKAICAVLDDNGKKDFFEVIHACLKCGTEWSVVFNTVERVFDYHRTSSVTYPIVLRNVYSSDFPSVEFCTEAFVAHCMVKFDQI